MSEPPLLEVSNLSKSFGATLACHGVNFAVWLGEVVGIVGESGSGKTTVLRTASGQLAPDEGRAVYRDRSGAALDIYEVRERERRRLARTDWAFVHQNPRDGLRMGVSAGANVAERLIAIGDRHYGNVRGRALDWFDMVEVDGGRIDDLPRTFSGGMQQRLQIARNLITGPRIAFMDEPTGGLDVSVQARLLDLLRGLVADLGLAAIVVTHDLAVARLLSHQLMVMRHGEVVEQGLTDRVLDDPQHPYTQLLVSAVLQP
jgi:putative phosphonate transport system ATP-binding protein